MNTSPLIITLYKYKAWANDHEYTATNTVETPTEVA